MKNLIFLGGIQCSGKSYIVDRLTKKNSNYVGLSFDDLEYHMQTNANDFFYYSTLLNPNLKEKFELLGVNLDGDDLTIEQLLLKKKLFQRGEYDNWTRLLQESMFTYLAKTLLDVDGSSTPIIESLFYYEEMRVDTFKRIKEHMYDVNLIYLRVPLPIQKDFDLIKKTLVYLDFGLNVSLGRFEGCRFDKDMDESLLIRTYKKQKLPKNSELSNLEVIILSSQDEVEDFIKQY